MIEAEVRAVQGAPTWVYQMDFAGMLPNGRSGAFHTVDIPLAFDTVNAAGSGVSGPAAQSVSDSLSNAFVSLARSGDPNNRALPDWPRYTLPARQTIMFDEMVSVISDPRSEERQFFSNYPYVQPGT